MPNYVTNIVTLDGSEEDIQRLFESIKPDDGELGMISFNKIIPMPEELNIESGSKTTCGIKMIKEYVEGKMYDLGIAQPDNETIKQWEKELGSLITEDLQENYELGLQARENTRRFGHPTWYEWCINNWGTKWPACGYEYGRLADNKFIFETAWSAPHQIITKLSEMFPTIKMLHEWADEDFGYNCGYCEYDNGWRVEAYFPESQKEAYEFAAKVMRCDLDEMHLKLNVSGTNYVWCNLEDYNLANLHGRPALFCEERISEDDIPEGMYLYQLRHPSDEIYTLEQIGVVCDFAGSIITDYDIDFFDSRYLLLNSSNFRVMDEVGYLSFDDYLEKNFNFDQSNQILGDM